jgi:ABC-type glycerol-3-phosphate transport system substrate-binding protein
MRKTRKIVGIALILALAAVCGAFAAGGQDSAQTSGGDVLMRFMTWESAAMNEDMLKSFTSVPIPGVKVELEPTPLQDYGIKLQEMLAAGMAPDVFLVGNDMALNYWSAGLTADLTGHLQADPDFLNKFYQGSLPPIRWEASTSAFRR